MPFADPLSRERIGRVGAALDRDGVLAHGAALLAPPLNPVFAMAAPEAEVARHLARRREIAGRLSDATCNDSLRAAGHCGGLARRLHGPDA